MRLRLCLVGSKVWILVEIKDDVTEKFLKKTSFSDLPIAPSVFAAAAVMVVELDVGRQLQAKNVPMV
uniref:Uncharacterized protein n=1 Tax=Oryza sativa subsp. japonica TaxID=39947 RepID=Q6ZDA2_ORYSJ|nr:hypothetical protein [Oryza sativa Japonica Group]